MRRYALLKNNTVFAVLTLSDEEIAAVTDLVFDVETSPEVEVGWILVGNKLQKKSSIQEASAEQQAQQTHQRMFGQELSPFVVDKIGTRNIQLSSAGVVLDVVTLAVQMQSVKLLIETGALKTARGLCVALQGAFPLHKDIFDYVITEISSFLVASGYE